MNKTGAVKDSEITDGIRQLDISTGSTVFLHSSLSSIGEVSGGAQTVVDALLGAIGNEGTLIVPTFTPVKQRDIEHGPIFDPENDISSMGAISEEVRKRPASRRSNHIFHSVAAIGADSKLADSHGPSAWAADGPFWRLHELDGTIMLLGVPYLRCTFFHMIEQLFQTPYRHWIEFEARLQKPSGTIHPLVTRCFVPKPDFIGNDFNKFGAILEKNSMVQIGLIGNAITRMFRARDAVSLAVELYRDDPQLFVRTGDQLTELRDGYMVGELGNEKTVIDAGRIYKISS